MSISDPDNPSAMQQLINRGSHSSFRDWDFSAYTNNAVYSDWVSLTQGVKYYYEAPLNQGSGEVHLSVGVEIEPDSGTHSYPRHSKQVMTFGLEQDLIRDTMEVNVTLADDLYFVLMYQDMTSLEFEASGEIKAGCTADEFKEGIKAYYSARFGTDPTVSRHCTNVNATAVIDCATTTEDIESYIYTV